MEQISNIPVPYLENDSKKNVNLIGCNVHNLVFQRLCMIWSHLHFWHLKKSKTFLSDSEIFSHFEEKIVFSSDEH